MGASALASVLPMNMNIPSPDGSDGKESACRARDWVPYLGWEELLKKEMVNHSSILASRIPSKEESGGLQSMG